MHAGTANRPVQVLLTPSWWPRHNTTVKEEEGLESEWGEQARIWKKKKWTYGGGNGNGNGSGSGGGGGRGWAEGIATRQRTFYVSFIYLCSGFKLSHISLQHKVIFMHLDAHMVRRTTDSHVVLRNVYCIIFLTVRPHMMCFSCVLGRALMFWLFFYSSNVTWFQWWNHLATAIISPLGAMKRN